MQVESVVSIHDSDTIKVNLANCDHPILCKEIPIRINGIDTPEIWTKCASEKLLAEKARTIMEGLINGANKIELRNTKRGKYFRIVADVYADGVNVAQEEIFAGLAHPYDGGTKIKWCTDKGE